MMERWKPIPGFEPYEASDLGRIRRNGRILKPRRFKNGYMNINIKGYQKYVHRVVFETFHGTITDGFHVDHIDANTQNNTLENLQQLSPWANVIRSRRGTWWRTQTTIPEFDNEVRK